MPKRRRTTLGAAFPPGLPPRARALLLPAGTRENDTRRRAVLKILVLPWFLCVCQFRVFTVLLSANSPAPPWG